MTQSGYQKIEYGERDPKLDVLVSLCDIFDVSADFLLGRDHSTEDTERYLRLVYEKINLLGMYEGESNSLLMRVSELKTEMLKAAQEKGFVDEYTMAISEQLDMRISDYEKVNDKIKTIKFDIEFYVKSYIESVMEVPESHIQTEEDVAKIEEEFLKRLKSRE
jgi:transcriptional regulator with XRE-family HTH domain